MRRVSNLLLLVTLVGVPLVIAASVYTAFRQGQEGAPSRPGSQQGLIAHWNFQGNLGDRVIDAVGGHRGILHDPIWVTSRKAFSTPVLRFDGEKTYIEVPPAPELALAGSFTLAAWVKVDSNRRRQALVQVADPGGDLRRAPVTFYVPWGEGRLGLVLSDGRKRVGFLSDKQIRSGQWQHVAVAYDGQTGQIRFYIDGEPAGERTTSWRPRPDQGGPLLIGVAGSASPGWHRYQGELLSLSVYARELDPTEIEELARQALAPAPKPLSTP